MSNIKEFCKNFLKPQHEDHSSKFYDGCVEIVINYNEMTLRIYDHFAEFIKDSNVSKEDLKNEVEKYVFEYDEDKYYDDSSYVREDYGIQAYTVINAFLKDLNDIEMIKRFTSPDFHKFFHTKFCTCRWNDLYTCQFCQNACCDKAIKNHCVCQVSWKCKTHSGGYQNCIGSHS